MSQENENKVEVANNKSEKKTYESLSLSLSNDYLAKKLLIAVMDNDIETIKELIDKQVNINITNLQGKSILMLAEENNNKEMYGLLMKHCHFYNPVSRSAKSHEEIELLRLSKKNEPENLKLFLDEHKDIDVNVSGKDGFTPLHIALAKNYTENVFILLQQSDIDIHITTPNNLVPIQIAILNNNLAVVNALIDKKAPINIKNIHSSPLHIAVSFNYFQIVENLLEHSHQQDTIDVQKIDINETDYYCRSALFLAVLNNNIKAVKCLLKFGANINYIVKKINDGRSIPAKLHYSILMMAVENNYFAMIKLLIENGADVAYTYKDLSPLMIAIENSQYQVIKYLHEKGAMHNDKKVFEIIVEQNNISLLQLFIQDNYTIPNETSQSISLFRLASQLKRKSILMLLKKNLALTPLDKLIKLKYFFM